MLKLQGKCPEKNLREKFGQKLYFSFLSDLEQSSRFVDFRQKNFALLSILIAICSEYCQRKINVFRNVRKQKGTCRFLTLTSKKSQKVFATVVKIYLQVTKGNFYGGNFRKNFFLILMIETFAKNLMTSGEKFRQFFQSCILCFQRNNLRKSFFDTQKLSSYFRAFSCKCPDFWQKNSREIQNYYYRVREFLRKKLYVFRKIKYLLKLPGFFAKKF